MMRLLLAVLLALAPAAALSHSFYDWQCCSDNDCKPVDDPDEVTAAPDGYHFRQWVVPYADAKMSPTKDFHACIIGERLICFYAPASAF